MLIHNKQLRLLISAGMIDVKLASKLVPLLHNPRVSAIDLVRKIPYSGRHRGLRVFSPPKWLRQSKLAVETYRFIVLLWLAITRRPDCLIAMGIIPNGFYVFVIGKMLGIPIIQHVMGKNDLRIAFPGQYGARTCLRILLRSDYIGVRGTRSRDLLLAAGIKPDRLFIPQNLHDFEIFSPAPSECREFDLIYVGILEPYKRLDMLLDAFAIARTSLPALKLLIVGSGSEFEQLKRRVAAMQLEDQVRFTGAIGHLDLPDLYRSARIFIMTSQGEGLPQAMIEAMSCGIPPIVFSDADIEDLAHNGINSLVVKESRPDAFANAILALANNSVLYGRLVDGCLEFRKHYRDVFSLEYQRRIWDDILVRVTTRYSGRNSG